MVSQARQENSSRWTLSSVAVLPGGRSVPPSFTCLAVVPVAAGSKAGRAAGLRHQQGHDPDALYPAPVFRLKPLSVFAESAAARWFYNEPKSVKSNIPIGQQIQQLGQSMT
jgi:hypothetical protein